MCREIDAADIKPDYNIWGTDDKQYYYKFGLFPWQKLGDIIFIVASNTNHKIIRWLEKIYNNNFILFKSGYNQVIDSLNDFFGYTEFSTNYLYYKIDSLLKI